MRIFAELPSHPVEHRGVDIKELMRDAAIHARDCMFQEHPHGKHSRLLRLGSIAQTVRTADHRLHQKLSSILDIASQHVFLNEGVISLLDAVAFGEAFRCAKLEASCE